MTRSSSRTLLVAKNAKGKWSVATQDAATSQVFDTKAKAVEAARRIVRQDGGVLQVANTNGRVSASFTLGRTAMTKLNVVEGVFLSTASERAFKEFDREGLSPKQRRAKPRKDLTVLSAGTIGNASSRSGRAKPIKA